MKPFPPIIFLAFLLASCASGEDGPSDAQPPLDTTGAETDLWRADLSDLSELPTDPDSMELRDQVELPEAAELVGDLKDLGSDLEDLEGGDWMADAEVEASEAAQADTAFLDWWVDAPAPLPCTPACAPGWVCLEAACRSLSDCRDDYCIERPEQERLTIQQKVTYIDRFEYPGALGLLPTSRVTLTQAQAACGAQGKRLCTDAELYFACTYLGGGPYPYFDLYHSDYCNTETGSAAACDAHPQCRPIALPVFDLVGNLAEWTAEGRLFGGSFSDGSQATCSDASAEGISPEQVGFRCCSSPTDDRDGDGFGASVDCDDLDELVFPGAPEVCDGVDSDCLGDLDEVLDLCEEDGSPCTVQRCAGFGGCVQDPVPGPCEDGSLCTLNDQCQGGLCVPGTPKICDPDLDACLTGECDPAKGVCLVIDCADDNPCTYDGCHQQECRNEALPDPFPRKCKTGICDPLTGYWGYIEKDCSDNDPCTVDSCNFNTGECQNEPDPSCS